MEQGQIPPGRQPPPASPPWTAWQQQPAAWGQTPPGHAPQPFQPAPWAVQQSFKAPPDEHPEDLPWRLAGWWSRVGAQLIDVLIVWVPAAIVLGALAVGADSARDGSGTETALLVIAIVTSFVALGVHLFYAPLLMRRAGRRNGQTWGKQACGIRVIRADGRSMRFADAALRQIVFKSFGGLVASTFVPLFPWMLNYLWPTWDEQHRALHDLAADTRVVDA